MNIKVRSSKDFYAGLVLLFFGLLALGISRGYPMGTAARMGPGFFPLVLGIVLALLGFIIAARSLWGNVEGIDPFGMRPLILILGAVISFAVIVQPLGLVFAILGLVVISSLASEEYQPFNLVVLYFVLAAIGVGVFVYGLGLPFRVWPF